MTQRSELLHLLSAGPKWQIAAACADPAEGAVFLDALSGDPRAVPAAIAICRRCPVSTECDEHATTHDERSGVWGGVARGPRHRGS